jgi:hypothetical protein
MQDLRSLSGASLFSFNDDEASLNHTAAACQLGGAEERTRKYPSWNAPWRHRTRKMVLRK